MAVEACVDVDAASSSVIMQDLCPGLDPDGAKVLKAFNVSLEMEEA